ncbi:MAG: hypothetical protein AVDCRST_MAG93-8789, partial [uncultured Chloroflexia bacterium]
EMPEQLDRDAESPTRGYLVEYVPGLTKRVLQ